MVIADLGDYITMWGGGNFALYKGKKEVSLTPDQKKVIRNADMIYRMLTKREDIKHQRWGVNSYVVGAEGLKLIEDNRERLAKIDEKKAAQIDKVRRYVIIQKWRSGSYRNENMGKTRQFDGLFEVTRETDKRLYGKLILPETKREDAFWYVRANRGDAHVDREQVMVDPATPELFEKLQKIEDSRFASLEEQQTQMEAELEEVQRRHENREKQSAAMFGDMMVEAGVSRETVNGLLDRE